MHPQGENKQLRFNCHNTKFLLWTNGENIKWVLDRIVLLKSFLQRIGFIFFYQWVDLYCENSKCLLWTPNTFNWISIHKQWLRIPAIELSRNTLFFISFLHSMLVFFNSFPLENNSAICAVSDIRAPCTYNLYIFCSSPLCSAVKYSKNCFVDS